MQAPAGAQEGSSSSSSHPNNGHNNSSSGGDNSDANRSTPLGGDGVGPCQHHHGIPPRSSVCMNVPSHAGHLHRILSMKAAAAAAQGGPEGPSRMERIRTLSRAYSSMHPHHDGGGGGGMGGDGRAAPAGPERGPLASAEEEQPGEEEGDGLLFALETRVKNLEAIEAAEPWRPKVSQMIRAYKQPEEIARMKQPRMQKYYRRQNALLEFYEEEMLVAACKREGGGRCVQLPPLVRKRRAAAEEEDGNGAERKSSLARLAINLSFGLNVSLVAVKILALVLSGSVAMLASVVDSCLDLLNGLVLFLTRRSIDTKQYYEYPQGKKRLEPVGVLIFATAMALTSIEIIKEAIERLIAGFTSTPPIPKLDLTVNIVLVYTIASKLGMGLFCRAVAKRTGSSTVRAYGIDHFNDVASNALGIGGMVLAAKVQGLWWMDPAVAVAISIFILLRWAAEGLLHIGHVVGKAARPIVLKKLAFLACNAHPSVAAVETTLAYHFGERVLAEVDIVLPPTMALEDAHDVGETLQKQIEALEEVERGFVHLDVDATHPFEHVVKD